MRDLIIREATAKDLPAVADLWEKLDIFHRNLGLAFPASEDDSRAWVESFERTLGRYSFLWLAEQSDDLLGFLMGRLKRVPAYLGGVIVGEISDLYVDESLRGHGLGAKLVDLAVNKFKSLDVQSIEVQILSGNEPGHKFWLKQGFKTELTQMRLVIEE